MTDTTSAPGVQIVPSRPMLFLYGISFGLAAILLALQAVPPSSVGAVSVMLSALGCVEIVQRLFRRHRDLSWSGESPQAASNDLVFNLFCVFLGLTVAFVIFSSRLPESDLRRAFAPQVMQVLVSDSQALTSFGKLYGATALSGLIALAVTLLLAAIYQEGGVALLVSWLASLWGIGGVAVLWSVSPPVPVTAALLVLGALVVSSIGLLTASTCGVFVSRAAHKYGVTSPAFRRVFGTSFLLLVAALGFVLFSAALTAASGLIK